MKINMNDLRSVCELELAKPQRGIKLPAGVDGSQDRLKWLYRKHLSRYSEMLGLSINNPDTYNRAELTDLLAAWHEVLRKNFVYDDLSPRTQGEVYDAIMDEEE